jgi:hypothetical protein
LGIISGIEPSVSALLTQMRTGMAQLINERKKKEKNKATTDLDAPSSAGLQGVLLGL